MNCQREKNNLFRNFAFLFRFPAQSTVSGVAFCGFLRFPALFVYPESPLLYFDRHEFQKIPNYFPVFNPPPEPQTFLCLRCSAFVVFLAGLSDLKLLFQSFFLLIKNRCAAVFGQDEVTLSHTFPIAKQTA